MSYIQPDMVLSPKGKVSELKVLHDDGECSWSLAELKWDGNNAIGLRWNGGSGDQRFPGIGNPQSRGVPTWFILPDELAQMVIAGLKLSDKISK